ncbi:tripartite tricarboxylate transporter substrate-binding protein [Cupriavidus basilensis]
MTRKGFRRRQPGWSIRHSCWWPATSTGIKSLEDLARAAKAKPAGLNFASAGKGNSTHLVVEMLEQRLGLQLTHVPYNGAAAGLTSVMGNQTQLMADVLNTAAVQANGGKVQPLAVIGTRRASGVPNVPTLAELGVKRFSLCRAGTRWWCRLARQRQSVTGSMWKPGSSLPMLR